MDISEVGKVLEKLESISRMIDAASEDDEFQDPNGVFEGLYDAVNGAMHILHFEYGFGPERDDPNG